MKIFLLITILILIVILVYQEKEIRELEKKTLDAFRIVCQKVDVRPTYQRLWQFGVMNLQYFPHLRWSMSRMKLKRRS